MSYDGLIKNEKYTLSKLESHVETIRRAADELDGMEGEVSCVVKKQNSIFCRFRMPGDELAALLDSYAAKVACDIIARKSHVKILEMEKEAHSGKG